MKTDRRREEGAVLFVAILMLALMGTLAIAALDAASRDRQTSGFYNRSETAFYAAEAAASHGRALVRGVTDRSTIPAFPSLALGTQQAMGDAALYDREANLPIYYGDPAFPNAVRYAADSGIYAGGGNLQQKGQKFTNTLWQINVAGQSPDGSVSRIEVMETKILTSGY